MKDGFLPFDVCFYCSLLGAFAELRKATRTFFMSVFAPPNSSAPTGRIYVKFGIWVFFFRKFVQKITVPLKSDKHKGHFTIKTNIYFWSYLTQFLLRMKNVSDKTCRENQNTHFVFSDLFFKSCGLWDNVGKMLYSGADLRWQYGACALCAE